MCSQTSVESRPPPMGHAGRRRFRFVNDLHRGEELSRVRGVAIHAPIHVAIESSVGAAAITLIVETAEDEFVTIAQIHNVGKPPNGRTIRCATRWHYHERGARPNRAECAA